MSGRLSSLKASIHERYLALCKKHNLAPLEGGSLSRCLDIWLKSDFLRQYSFSHLSSLPQWLEEIDQPYAPDHDRFIDSLASLEEEEVLSRLRKYGLYWRCALAWRDFENNMSTVEVFAEISTLGEACVRAAYQAIFTPPHDRLMVVAMGKLGAEELNYSSDIDLIFTYPDDCKPEHNVYREKAQRFVRYLHQRTAEGYVFRVDTRLRPFGTQGDVICSASQLMQYYSDEGRDWERFALIRARIITGKADDQAVLLRTIHDFVYRPYLDYGVKKSIWRLRERISEESKLAEHRDNLKLGEGGIRELEFVVQSIQLTYAAKLPVLRTHSTVKAMKCIRNLKLHSVPEGIDDFQGVYAKLRDCEHALQLLRDQQTHTLPKGDEDRERVAFALGYEDWQACERAIEVLRAEVHGCFSAWLGSQKEEKDVESLTQWQRSQCQQAFDRMMARQVSDEAKQRFYALLVEVDQYVGDVPGLTQLIDWMYAVLPRSTYLAMCNEYPGMALLLADSFERCPYWLELCTRRPFLLGMCFASGKRVAVKPLERLSADLAYELNWAKDRDEVMEKMRHFTLFNKASLALSECYDDVPLMGVSDYLTSLAETVLLQSAQYAWGEITERYGLPVGLAPGEQGFTIIGFGKLGGGELSYHSDLDLVFIYNDNLSDTEGAEQSLPPAQFYNKLVQRILSYLSTRTYSGPLYHIDTRLRPSGSSGLLVTSISAFERYQLNDAWTWEHQALVRARAVLGDKHLCQRFTHIRQQVLQACKHDELAENVVNMRARLRDEKDRSSAEQFDLQQGRGGIVDIEFLVQYTVLKLAAEHTELSKRNDNIRLLALCEEQGWLSQARALSEAYLAYRAEVHACQLNAVPTHVDHEKFQAHIKTVQSVWHETFISVLERGE